MDLIEDRIADLERKVFGHEKPSSEDVPSTPASESIIQSTRTLNAIIAGHEKTSSVLKRLKELSNLVDMACDDSSAAAKLEVSNSNPDFSISYFEPSNKNIMYLISDYPCERRGPTIQSGST